MKRPRMFVMLPPFGKTRLHFPILKPDKRFIHHLRIMRKPKPVHNPNRLITCKIDRFSDNQLITALYLRRIFASRHGNQRRNRHRCNPPYFSCIHTNLHCFIFWGGFLRKRKNRAIRLYLFIAFAKTGCASPHVEGSYSNEPCNKKDTASIPCRC